MRYFNPVFEIATLCGIQDKLISKIGGVPWGFPPSMVPTCCDRPQKLLAQLCHEPPMLDLGAPGCVLHLFQCLECWGIEECGRGVVLLDQSRLNEGLNLPAEDETLPAWDRQLVGELWITGWDAADDGIPSSRLPECFTETRLRSLHNEFNHIDWFHPMEKTKFGGTPRWTANGPQGYPPPPFEFLFQIDNSVPLQGSPPDPNQVGCGLTVFAASGSPREVHHEPEPGKHRINAPWTVFYEEAIDCLYADFTNLGSDGTIYAFIDRTQHPPEVRWFWNR